MKRIDENEMKVQVYLAGAESVLSFLQPKISDSMWFFFVEIGSSGSGAPNILVLRPPGGAKTLEEMIDKEMEKEKESFTESMVDL